MVFLKIRTVALGLRYDIPPEWAYGGHACEEPSPLSSSSELSQIL